MVARDVISLEVSYVFYVNAESAIASLKAHFQQVPTATKNPKPGKFQSRLQSLQLLHAGMRQS